MKKYRMYVDEVGNSDLKSSTDPNHRYLSLTGVIFDLEYIANILFADIEELKKKYFGSHPDEPIILHRKEIVNKKYPFKSLQDPIIEKSFNTDILSKLGTWEFTIITVLIDKLEHKNRYSVWRYDAYHYCLEILTERFYKFLSDKNAVGDIMIESRGGKEDTRLKKSYSRILSLGTNFIDSEKLQEVFTSTELKVKQKSANVSGLQVADLVAFPSRRYILKKFDLYDDKRVTFNEEIIEIIKNKYFEVGGKAIGWGIKLLP